MNENCQHKYRRKQLYVSSLPSSAGYRNVQFHFKDVKSPVFSTRCRHRAEKMTNYFCPLQVCPGGIPHVSAEWRVWGPLLWLSKPIVGDVSVWWWAPLLPACHCFKHQMVKMVYDAAGLMRKQKGFVLFEKKNALGNMEGSSKHSTTFELHCYSSRR